MKFACLFRAGLAVLAFVALGTGAASAACSDASLSGVWGALARGNGGPGKPGAAILQFTADGAGNISNGSETSSSNGTIGTLTFTGTYTVARKCTGDITIRPSSGKPTHLHIVLDDLTMGFEFIATDPNELIFGSAYAQGAASCSLAGLKGKFGLTLTGGTTAQGNGIVLVASMVAGGNGNLFGTGTNDAQDTVSSVSFTGGYSVNSNCNATAHLTSGDSTENFAFVLLDGGEKAFFIETDPNSLFAGTLEK